MQYIQSCGLYKEQALQAWAPGHIADPWLIAATAVNDYTIITAEVPSGGLSPKNPACIFSCCSVMYSQKIKSGYRFRFIVSGGTFMTIITTVKSIMVGTGSSGNLYKNMQEHVGK